MDSTNAILLTREEIEGLKVHALSMANHLHALQANAGRLPHTVETHVVKQRSNEVELKRWLLVLTACFALGLVLAGRYGPNGTAGLGGAAGACVGWIIFKLNRMARVK
jgi:hypothetical protein